MKIQNNLLTAVMLLSFGAASPAAPISLDSLLDEMIDRPSLARFPEPAYTCQQASSYDRASTAPNQPGWFANKDLSFFLRSEKHAGREEWVMMDAKGPGAIVRCWTPNTSRGTIRIYLDGSDAPTIEARAVELIGGTTLVGPPLSQERAGGRNLYLPIPYAKHCKVTYEGPYWHTTKIPGDAFFYQINYRTYAPEAEVVSFTQAQMEKAQEKIARLQATLLNPGGTLPENVKVLAADSQSVAPDGQTSLTVEGPGAICRLEVRLAADDPVQALRSTVLAMDFDGEPTVWCPVSDFFESGVGVNPFQGWYRRVAQDGTMTCWWVMPYKESCTIRLKNLGDREVRVAAISVTTCPWTWDDRSMHFHCTWWQERNIPTKSRGENETDWNYLAATGQGVFVGDTLALVNRVDTWWGEGDEKIYVDDETFPSHFGTGTEDYYGYSACMPERFESPFHAQPRAEGQVNFGNTTNTRVRLLDAIPFRRSFRFDMEIWHWATTTVDYAATTYWYGRPGARVDSQLTHEEAKQPVRYKTPRPAPVSMLSATPTLSAVFQRPVGFVPRVHLTAMRSRETVVEDTQPMTTEQIAEEKELQERYPAYRGVDPDYLHAGKEALEQWWDWKYGLRIHWGVYSLVGSNASWGMAWNDAEYKKRYNQLYKKFNPTEFDADEWADLMVRGGMKFYTFTTKHHDGFAMWDTKTRVRKRLVYTGPGPKDAKIEDCDLAYGIMDTPFKRDIVKELVDATRKRNLGIGLYFSHWDWYDADFRWSGFDKTYFDPHFSPETDPEGWKRFLARHRGQITELMSNYGKIDLLGFDCMINHPIHEKTQHPIWKKAWPEIKETIKTARRLQPNVLMRQRGIYDYGDYFTPEGVIPASPEDRHEHHEKQPWMVIYPCGTPSYVPNDGYRPASWILHSLIDIVAKGGVFEVGFGPMPNGKFDDRAVERIEYVGRWLKVNGEAIYKTRPWVHYEEGNDIRYTRSKDGKYVYAISLKWPGDRLTLKKVQAREGSEIHMLGVKEPLDWRNDPKQGLTIEIPAHLQAEEHRHCKQAYAFRIEGLPVDASPATR